MAKDATKPEQSKETPAAAAAPAEKPAIAPPAAPAAAATAEAPKPVVPATAADLLSEGEAAKKVVKAKHSKNVIQGIAHIMATFNNTTVSITDPKGRVIGWSSAGRVGFKGSRKSTAYAAQLAAQDAARQGMAHG